MSFERRLFDDAGFAPHKPWPCHTITTGRGRRRCTAPISRDDHSHYRSSEPVPDDCACHYICSCTPSETVLVSDEKERPEIGATSAEVIHLDDHRGGFDGLTCPECDGAWFLTEGITLDKHGHVGGYALPIKCKACGHVM